ncbi:MAG: YlmH/Sll1252 family protein [Veillonellaceae bacterium]|nr:YlmH/Sll1252 family protein [Veillonellaceae bacterium]
MSEREKISRYFAAQGQGELAERLLDMAERVRAGRPFGVSDFHTPLVGQIATTIRAHYPDLETAENGGYPGAERIKVAFFSAGREVPIEWDIAAVRITWDPRFRLIGHRDVLGSLLGLGLEREVFGDILMQADSAQVVVDRPLVSFLEQELTKVSAVGVRVAEMPLEELKPKEEKLKEVRATVASLRLDTVGAAGFGLSRAKMTDAIRAERVQVNWQRAKGPAQTVAQGDVISLRGRGRMIVAEVLGTSRKGRIAVRLERYQ